MTIRSNSKWIAKAWYAALLPALLFSPAAARAQIMISGGDYPLSGELTPAIDADSILGTPLIKSLDSRNDNRELASPQRINTSLAAGLKSISNLDEGVSLNNPAEADILQEKSAGSNHAGFLLADRRQGSMHQQLSQQMLIRQEAIRQALARRQAATSTSASGSPIAFTGNGPGIQGFLLPDNTAYAFNTTLLAKDKSALDTLGLSRFGTFSQVNSNVFVSTPASTAFYRRAVNLPQISPELAGYAGGKTLTMQEEAEPSYQVAENEDSLGGSAFGGISSTIGLPVIGYRGGLAAWKTKRSSAMPSSSMRMSSPMGVDAEQLFMMQMMNPLAVQQSIIKHPWGSGIGVTSDAPTVGYGVTSDTSPREW